MTAPIIEAWRLRHQLQRMVQSFFDQRDYLSLDTPILVPMPGTEVYLNYFATQWIDHTQTKHPLYLRSSPELHLKRALAAGVPRVYHLGRCFRNEGEIGRWHHPEFTMLEWYETGISYADFMTQTEEFLRYTAQELAKVAPIALQLPARIPRITVAEAFQKFAGLTLVDEDPGLTAEARRRNFPSIQADDDFETTFFKILLDYVEPGLKTMGTVFLYDYPASQAALAKVEAGVARRFELYVGGVELCNAFQELTGGAANRTRIETARQKRHLLGKTVPPIDEEFMTSMQQGLPECCGNALGFDRWLSLLTGHDFNALIPFRQSGVYQGQPLT